MEQKMGGGTFANKTFANRTFANGEIPGGALAKVQWTFANWRNSRGCTGESTVDFRQLSRNNINIGWMSDLNRNAPNPKLLVLMVLV
jgi:hypothetical protein